LAETTDELLPLNRAFRIGYGLGLAICVAWPLAIQLMLGSAIRSGTIPPLGVARQLGYTFSGLTMLAALFVTWRWGKVRDGFKALAPRERPAVLLRETLVYAALFELTTLYGIIYYALAGPLAERYARSFVALTTIMFFVFVPRLDAWREAAQGE
jgi:hypothetical protein